MYLLSLKDGQATLSLPPETLSLLHEMCTCALREEFVAPDRQADRQTVYALAAAFKAAEIACQLQLNKSQNGGV